MKPKQKASFQRELGLPERDVPLLGVVTRLAEQKGVDLIIQAMERLLNQDVQFVILGSGDYFYESRLKKLESEHPDKVSANILFNQGLARRIYGSVDIFLMPSLFEPCGLSQLYSLRYGTVPVVRRTGGLGDTIVDYNENREQSTGFLFKNYNSDEFVQAIQEAMTLYENKDAWNALVERGMRTRFSWNKAAKEYIEQYERIME